MAGKSTERTEIEELIRISDEARGQLGIKVAKVRNTLKVPGQLVGSMRHHPKFWLFGSMAAGLGASLLVNKLTGPRTKPKGSILRRAAVALTLTAVRPLAKVWLTNQLKNLGSKWVAERIQPQQPKPMASPFHIEPEPNPAHVRTPRS